MRAAITVPAFTDGLSSVLYAFGTKGTWQRPGLDPVRVKQVHGTDILLIPGSMKEDDVQEAAGAQGYDAIVTDRSETLVTVRTADCVPILFLDPDRRVVAAVHAGWRGTIDRIAQKAIEVMHVWFRCHRSSIRVAIGPSIGRCCYEVDSPVLAPLKDAFDYWSEVVEETGPGRGQLDLRLLNQRQLKEAGVQATHMTMVNLCTACHPDLFYSYRRDGTGTQHMTSGIALI